MFTILPVIYAYTHLFPTVDCSHVSRASVSCSGDIYRWYRVWNSPYIDAASRYKATIHKSVSVLLGSHVLEAEDVQYN